MDPEQQTTGTDGQATTEVPGDAPIWQDAPGVVVGGGIVGAVILIVTLWATLMRGAPPQPTAPPPGVEVVAPVPPPVVEPITSRLRQALSRSRAMLQERFDALFATDRVDQELFDDLETTLLSADIGMSTTTRLLDRLKSAAASGDGDPGQLRALLRDEMRKLLDSGDHSLHAPKDTRPWVILVVGVNGSGKTTTIGKLAANLHKDGKKVLMAAGDTFRAAAIEQLTVWAERAEADIVAHQEGADPGAVVYDALQAAIARGHDVVIIDTAGRLQTRKPLMEQLSKIRRVIDKVVPGAPHETLLVVDGTMGQNALSQAQLFNEATPLTGVVVTKLDGTAKGGMVLTLASELGLPVKLIGIGEKVEDLRPFDPDAFVEALA